MLRVKQLEGTIKGLKCSTGTLFELNHKNDISFLIYFHVINDDLCNFIWFLYPFNPVLSGVGNGRGDDLASLSIFDRNCIRTTCNSFN